MKRVLVTGAAGNIGSALADRLLQENYEVIAVDNLMTGSTGKLPQPQEKFTFIRADVNSPGDINSIMTAYRFNYVFHYAAVVGVARTLDNPVLVLKDIEGIRNVLDLCKNTGVERVFYSSSSEVYGEPVEFPQNESTTPLNSRLPYAVVKNVGEAFLRSYYKAFGLNYTILRFFNTYGPRQSEDFVVSRFISQALANKDITIYGKGSQTRTFCYIEDNIDTTVTCLKDKVCVNDVMNVGNDEEITILQLAETIISITGSRSKIVHLKPLPEGDMSRRCPDISKMRNVIARPLTSLEDGVRRTLEKREL